MEVLSPNVYFKEKSGGLAPVSAAGTSTVLFVGTTKVASGNLEVTPILNYTEFVSIFGRKSNETKDKAKEANLYGLVDEKKLEGAHHYLAYAVKHFFAEGGTSCYVLNLNSEKGLKKFDTDILEIVAAQEDITIVCYPDLEANENGMLLPTVFNSACERINAFAILDSARGASHLDLQAKPTDEKELKKYFLDQSKSTQAVYYPWVTVARATAETGTVPTATTTINIPPSCVVAGVFARNDGDRGVHKAPAGITSGVCSTVYGLATAVTEIEHDIFLSAMGKDLGLRLNMIRPMIGAGQCIWGARTLTTTSDLDGRYINVSRLEIFLKDSLRDGLTWVTFKPNNKELWGQVERTITAFMRKLWQQGALFGSKEEEAFQVIINDSNNPPSSVARGELNITLKFAPVKPAEFVVITFTQKTLEE